MVLRVVSGRACRGLARGRSSLWSIGVLRALVFVLALPLMSAGALPFWAQLAGVEGPHVCHCSVEKHDCVCPRCNTDHGDALGAESLKGRCGDDELAFPGKLLLSVLPATFVIAPVAARIASDHDALPPFESLSLRPPTPPPRLLSSRA